MTLVRNLAHAEGIVPVDGMERAFNKLTRTFAMQMEALKRYRSGAEQKVTLHTRFSRRRRAGDCRQRHTRATRERAGEGHAGEGCANAKHGQNKEHDPLSVRRKSNK
jgi:hypothetical protein